ncbi:MAG: nitroreductase family protein [Planctomycetota bacterium]
MAESLLDAWAISETGFPRTGGSADQLRFLVNYAVLAPSTHNTQPWLFKIGREKLELYADRTRRLAVGDPKDRELTMSCGASLFHLRVAARHFGYRDVVETFPSPENPDLLARFGLNGPMAVAPEDDVLFQAITRRRTNRLPFEARPVPESLLSALRVAVAEEGVWCHLVPSVKERDAVAELVGAGAQRQLADKQYRREIAGWMRSNWTGLRDGMPGYAMGLRGLTALLAPSFVRTFDTGQAQGERDRRRAMSAPVLAVLGTESDTPQAWLAAGQAVARTLLRCRSEGVWASFFNQVIEVDDLRSKLSGVVGRGGFPQLLLRLGYCSEVRPTPRRTTSEVLQGQEG